MDLKQELLNYYNLTTSDLLTLNKEVCLNDIPLFFTNKHINNAVTRIQKAIVNNENILIYGDYDCDGIMSTSILYKALLSLNAKVSKYIPSRYKDGYGLTEEKVMLSKDKYSLIITVDNGISAIEACKKAKEIGIDVIVTDHHDPQEVLPECYEIIHPELSNLVDIKISGGFVAYFLASTLLKKHDEYLLSLASISTISDLMPLKDLNRDLVKLGISLINKYKYKNIISLVDNIDEIDYTHIGMSIAPKINAVGRMNEDVVSVNRLVNLFVSDDDRLIAKLAADVNLINEQRKEYTKSVVSSLKDYSSCSSITCLLDMKEGLLGLIATRLLTNYNVPVAIFSEESNDPSLLKASLRSKAGCNLSDFLSTLNFLLHHGGHAQAAGITIKKEDYDKFRSLFNDYALKNPFHEEIKAINITENDINEENYEIIKSFSPFGKDFEEPNFMIKRNAATLKLSFNKKSIITYIQNNNRIVCYNCSGDKNLMSNKYLKLFGNITKTTFQGKTYIDFLIKKSEVISEK